MHPGVENHPRTAPTRCAFADDAMATKSASSAIDWLLAFTVNDTLLPSPCDSSQSSAMRTALSTSDSMALFVWVPTLKGTCAPGADAPMRPSTLRSSTTYGDSADS